MKDIDLTIGDWTAQVTGIPRDLCRRRWQTDPPAQPLREVDWCALGTISVDTDPDAVITPGYIAVNGVFDVLFSFYGPHAMDNALLLRVGVYDRTYLEDANIFIGRAGTVRRVSAIINNLTLNRADIELRFNIREKYEHDERYVVSSSGVIHTDEGFVTTFDTERVKQ